MRALFVLSSTTKVYSSTDKDYCCRGKCDCNTCSIWVSRIRNYSTGFLSRFSARFLRRVFFRFLGVVRNFGVGDGKAWSDVTCNSSCVVRNIILFDGVDNLSTVRLTFTEIIKLSLPTASLIKRYRLTGVNTVSKKMYSDRSCLRSNPFLLYRNVNFLGILMRSKRAIVFVEVSGMGEIPYWR